MRYRIAGIDVHKKMLAVGICPGDDISAGEAHSTKSPKGNKNSYGAVSATRKPSGLSATA